MADELKKTEAPTAAAPQAQQQFAVDTTSLSAAYANFCRVTGTPEELVLDFGLNTQMTPIPNEPVKLTHRLVMNYFTAKRLLGALHMAVQQHESMYGVLETDIQKRVRTAGTTRPASPR
ncbi:MAG TPA: DUF3467 domain-containing protein [Gemmataceae bacterium]|nr:DUF3467 domain-containing protein [Gemmataceae bacterium]